MPTIGIVDDHVILLDGLKWVVSRYDFVDSVCAYGNANDLIEDLERGAQIDLVITDLQMPQMSGYDLINFLKKDYPHIRILVMTMFDSAYVVHQIKQCEVDGYFIKHGDQMALETALRTVLEGKNYWPNAMMDGNETERAALAKLTRREIEVLKLIAKNLSNKEIASQLYISEDTVLTHRKNMMSKLEIHSAAGLVAFVHKNYMN